MTSPAAYSSFGYFPQERNEQIVYYFNLGFTYDEITMLLCTMHGFNISVRHLKRVLKDLNLSRVKSKDRPDRVVEVVHQELQESASTLGYRSMHRRISQIHGVSTDRETVRVVLSGLDPNGVSLRRQRRLKRREYQVPGPNYLWHIDGWDKLKPFGFSIHGCIDGFSRKIMWLEASSSNKDPKDVCTYFAKTVQSLSGVPFIVRADRGTENVNVQRMQETLRSSHNDTRSTLNSTFLYGRSTANQRIEAWWSKFQQQGMSFWICHFKQLVDAGILDTSCDINIQCVRFCYMNLLRRELEEIMQLWNTHPMRRSRTCSSPSGKPDFIFNCPEVYEAMSYLQPLNQDDFGTLATELTGGVPDCNPVADELFCHLMTESHLQMPSSIQEADNLFVHLLDSIGIDDA